MSGNAHSKERSGRAGKLETIGRPNGKSTVTVTSKAHRSEAQGQWNEEGDWKSKLKNTRYRQKVIRSGWLCLCFCSLGLVSAQRGPAFLDLQILTNTNVQQASAFFAASAAGSVTGSLLSGLVFDLLSKSLLMVLSVLLMAAMTAATPFCSHYWLMVVVSFLVSCCAGSVGTGGNADMLRTWGGRGQAALHALHFSFAVGAVMAPLITEPFLAPTPPSVNRSESLIAELFLASTVTPLTLNPSDSLITVVNYSDSLTTESVLVPSSHQKDLSTSTPHAVNHGESFVTNPFQAFTSHTVSSSDPVNKEPFHFPTKHTVNYSDHAKQHFLHIGSLSEVEQDLKSNNHSADQAPYNSNDNNSPTSGKLDIRVMRKHVATAEQKFSRLPGTLLRTNSTLVSSDQSVDGTRVHFAFIISATLAFLSAVPLLLEHIKKRKSKQFARKRPSTQRVENEEDQNGPQQKEPHTCRLHLPLVPYLGIVLWACVLFLLFVAVEATFPSYLTVYAVLQMQWSKSQGVFLATLYWISFATSRLACIFLVKVLSSVQLLVTCLVLWLASLLAFLLASLWQLHLGVWLSSAVYGTAVAAVFPASLSWIDSELLPVNGKVTSAFMLSANVGAMLNPLVLGHLIENMGAIWLAYVLLGEATVSMLIFFPLLLFSRLYLQPRYPSSRECDDVSANVTAKGEQLEHSLGFLEKEEVEDTV